MDIESLIVYGIFIMIPVAIIYMMYSKNKKGQDFADFNPIPFENITKKVMQDKMKTLGKKVKNGSLLIGFDHIPYVDRYYQTKGEFPVMEYDSKENIYVESLDDNGEKKMEGYDFLMFRVKNSSFLLRIFGMGKSYFLIKNDIENIQYYPFDSTWKLPKGIDLIKYGDIWIDNISSGEYLNNMGIMDMNAQLMTHVLNFPNKVVHLETEQAKKERTSTKIMELEKAKYDDVKKAGDTSVG